MKLNRIAYFSILLIVLEGCNHVSFKGKQSSQASEPTKAENAPTQPESEIKGTAPQKERLVTETNQADPSSKSQIKLGFCAEFIEVAAKSNPWLAGAKVGTELRYPETVAVSDRAPDESPVLLDGNCIAQSKKLIFETESTANWPDGSLPQSGEGKVDIIALFKLGAIRGFSNLIAPFDSLVAVFLDENDENKNAAPENLDFSSPASRNFQQLEPRLHQVFFIGDGKTSAGTFQRFVVPSGAKRIALGNMSFHQWKKNTGSHRVRINELLP